MRLVKVCLGSCLLVLIWPALGLGAEVRPEIRYAYYDVPYTPGLSASEMIARHTVLANRRGRRIAATTDYLIRYEINHFSPVKGVCRVDNPKVFCECEITLPRLVGGEDDAGLAREFAAEQAELKRHELVHCDIAADYAGELLDSYRNFKDMLCADGEKAVSGEFERIVAECWEAQIRFDHSEYGYKDHLDVSDFQKEVGDNYMVYPQTKGDSRPVPERAAPHGSR